MIFKSCGKNNNPIINPSINHSMEKECLICNENCLEHCFSTCPHCHQKVCDNCSIKMDQCPFCRGEFGLWKCLLCYDLYILDERINYHLCLNDFPECDHQMSYPFVIAYLCVRKSHYGRFVERVWLNMDQEIVECCDCHLEIFE